MLLLHVLGSNVYINDIDYVPPHIIKFDKMELIWTNFYHDSITIVYYNSIVDPIFTFFASYFLNIVLN